MLHQRTPEKMSEEVGLKTVFDTKVLKDNIK